MGLIVTSQPVTPPASATPIQIGQYQGFLATQPTDQGLTLYVSIGTTGSTPWLVITSTGLSQSQITSMAIRALSS